MPGEELYDILGVPKGASAGDIKKAYHRLSLMKHPDRGGKKEEFQQLQVAYDVLKNPDTRARYDATGVIPGAAEEAGQPDIASVLQSMFGGGGFAFGGSNGFPGFGGFGGFGGGGGPPGRRVAPRGPNKIHDIGVSLYDLWHGKRISLEMSRDAKCTGCDGRGGKEMESCSGCGGKGLRQLVQQIGPMMSVRTEPCGACQGSGEAVKVRCETCAGARVLSRAAMIDVNVEPGMQDGDRIVFPGACSESPDFEQPGDVVLVIRAAAEPESPWLRKGADLAVEKQLTWAEAVMGWSAVWDKHPSGKQLRVVWMEGPVRDGEVLCVKGWGMPARGGRGCGDLKIICRTAPMTVSGRWTPDRLQALRKAWPEWIEPDETASGIQRPERCD